MIDRLIGRLPGRLCASESFATECDRRPLPLPLPLPLPPLLDERLCTTGTVEECGGELGADVLTFRAFTGVGDECGDFVSFSTSETVQNIEKKKDVIIKD